MATSYNNPGGKGDRLALITVTTNAVIGGGTPSNLVNGLNVANNTTASMWWNSGQTGRRLTFYFNGLSKTIQEAKWYQNGPANHGNWKWQGSNDNINFTDISASFLLNAGGAGDPIGDLTANTAGYLYYSMLQISGVTDSGPWIWEIEFKIDAGPAVAVTGTIAATEAGDVVSATGELITNGSLSISEDPDVAWMVGNNGEVISGSLVASDLPDNASFSGLLGAIHVTLAITEAPDEVTIAAGVTELTLATTEAPDTVEVEGHVRAKRRPVVNVLNT
jgi:hypothetical protein